MDRTYISAISIIFSLLFIINSMDTINAQENATEYPIANTTSLQNKTAVVLETENNETVIIIEDSEDNISSTNTPERVGSIITNLVNETGIVISKLPETLENATVKGGKIISNVSVPAGNILENITGRIIGIFE